MTKIVSRISRASALVFLFVGVISAVSPAFAEPPLPLFTASSDALPGTLSVGLRLNKEGVATSLAYSAPDGKPRDFDLRGLKNGMVIFSAAGRDVVTLRSANFDASEGGEFVLDYLYSGLSGERRKFIIELDRRGSEWVTSVNERSGRRSFRSLYLKSKKVLGKIVGIASITAR